MFVTPDRLGDGSYDSRCPGGRMDKTCVFCSIVAWAPATSMPFALLPTYYPNRGPPTTQATQLGGVIQRI